MYNRKAQVLSGEVSNQDAKVKIEKYIARKDISIDLRAANISMETVAEVLTLRQVGIRTLEAGTIVMPRIEDPNKSGHDILLILTSTQTEAFKRAHLRMVLAFAFSIASVGYCVSILHFVDFNHKDPVQVLCGLLVGSVYGMPFYGNSSFNYKKMLSGIACMEVARMGTYLATMLPVVDPKAKVAAYALIACTYITTSTKALSHQRLEMQPSPTQSAL